ncbi:arginase family protein [Corynebacterium sp.]|mgnify:CR=1 FL=1|jgi:arginase|uniref:arginase family protein n=1 Tax=Corynebacterium sp. TaxID=1720 RepID=UPI0025BA7F23|nr:arginase family protein [Corynebacterium sp.]
MSSDTTDSDRSRTGAGLTDSRTLRLIWPQWQGAGHSVATAALPGFPPDDARRGYALGAQVAQAILPDHHGPTEVVPVPDQESGSVAGIESRPEILASLAGAQKALGRHDWDRVLTVGGECSVSVAPFAALAEKYGDDLAVVWVDSHPDTDTPHTGYDGYHAMAVSTLTGHGDQEITGLLPATVDPSRVALAGLHAWEEDAHANVSRWGLTTFSPDELRRSSDDLLHWLAGTGASRVAVHLDVDVVDSTETALGLGTVPDGLTRAQVNRVINDLSGVAEVVGLTVAEFIPRDLMDLRGLLRGLPLLSD